MRIDTRIIEVNDSDSTESLREKLMPAAELIKNGGLVAFPTETVYGLGADATDPSATARIYEAKGRPSDNPLIIHIARPQDAEKYTYTGELYYRLAERFMPGPLTVVLPAKSIIPPTTRGGLPTVAVRCPSDRVASTLIELSGVPIAAPSANLSGSPSPTTAVHVISDMMGRADVIIAGADCEFGLESTIVQVDGGGVKLLRPGKITVEDIEALGIEVSVAGAVTDRLAEDEVALSPGMKYRHYAPKAPVLLLEGDRTSCAEYIRAEKCERVALICYSEDIGFYRAELPYADFYDFGGGNDRMTQAHRLFDILRSADDMNYDVIYAPLPKKDGIGLALYNRMIRAAAYKIIRL